MNSTKKIIHMMSDGELELEMMWIIFTIRWMFGCRREFERFWSGKAELAATRSQVTTWTGCVVAALRLRCCRFD